MTSPRDLADKDEGSSLGKWFESMAALVEAYPTEAGIDRNRTVEYNRSTASQFARAFNTRSKPEYGASDKDRVRAARHIYRVDSKGGLGLDDTHLEIIRNAGLLLEIHAKVPPDVMVEKMQKLFDAGRKYGIGISVHELEQDVIAIDIRHAPLPQPKLVLTPPAKRRNPGF